MGKDQTVLSQALDHVSSKMPHALEFGVAKGRSLGLIRQKLPKHEVFGFDTFTGLPEDWITSAGKLVAPKGCFSTDSKPPNIPNVKFFVGLFKDTIPQYLKIAKPIAFLHVDCDLYESAKEVLYNLNDYIVKDTIIEFDEWVYYSDPKYNDHEQKAFYEWVKDKNRKFEMVKNSVFDNPKTEQMIIKILE